MLCFTARGDVTVPQTIQQVLTFVEELDLPRRRRRKKSISEGSTPDVFELTKNQAMIVGADIVSFVAGTPTELREAIVNCSLLAQLAANRRVPSREEIRAWYEAYFDTLENLGWVVQERGFSEHRETSDDFEAHRAILSVAAVVLGPATTALAVVQSTLSAMKSMSEGPWMTVFRQESQAAKAARFQVTVVEPASKGGSLISLMAFELDAKTSLTQVLFFKFRSTDVTLRHSSGRVVVDYSMLAVASHAIAKKVSEYVGAYVEHIVI
jgi:hypothetical protein